MRGVVFVGLVLLFVAEVAAAGCCRRERKRPRRTPPDRSFLAFASGEEEMLLRDNQSPTQTNRFGVLGFGASTDVVAPPGEAAVNQSQGDFAFPLPYDVRVRRLYVALTAVGIILGLDTEADAVLRVTLYASDQRRRRRCRGRSP